jgi:hypothetical protein
MFGFRAIEDDASNVRFVSADRQDDDRAVMPRL